MPNQDQINISHLEWQVLGDHLRIWRQDGKAGISWEELQAVKDDAFGPESAAVEIYPPQSEIVNETNMRHLWLVPDAEQLPSLLHHRYWSRFFPAD